jgi:hypothetical protein
MISKCLVNQLLQVRQARSQRHGQLDTMCFEGFPCGIELAPVQLSRSAQQKLIVQRSSRSHTGPRTLLVSYPREPEA